MAISLERAHELVLTEAAPLPTEVVPVAGAAGRVLAGALRVRADSPAEPHSAMDGYAVAAGPAGRALRLVGESRAGAPSTARVDRDTAIRIATGAVLPAGAEAVVPIERASVADGRVTIADPVRAGWNVRPTGEDMRAGEVVLAAGTRLGAVELAVAIAAGHGEVVCHRRPRVALLGTGDELRDPGSRLEPGQIHDSNTIALAALVRRAEATVVSRGRIRDDPDATRDDLERACGRSDLVIVTGGVSVGRHDHVKPALAALGVEERFWGVELRPGRPTWFGRRGDVLVFGLPGSPVAAIVVFMLLGRPLLAGLEGAPATGARERARLTRPVSRHPHRTDAVRVRLSAAGGDGLRADPGGSPGAHLTTALLAADGLALVPPGTGELAAGHEVEIERLWP
jgi:molybdopterin molybdotransferase